MQKQKEEPENFNEDHEKKFQQTSYDSNIKINGIVTHTERKKFPEIKINKYIPNVFK
jgi:hypothetical protein